MTMSPEHAAAQSLWVSRSRLFSNWLIRIVPIIVTGALVAVLVSACRWQNISDLWRYLQPTYLFVVFALMTAAVALGAMSLFVLIVRARNLDWWPRFTLDYFYVQALCQLTPAQAAEITLPYIAGRGRFAPGEIAASLVIQRITAFWLILLVAISGADRWKTGGALWIAGGLGVFACLGLIFLITVGPVRQWLSDLVGRHFGSVLTGFYDTWRSVFRERRARLLAHVVLMAGRLLLVVVYGYASLLAFGIAAPFWLVAWAMCVAMLAAMVPISVNGIGVMEGIMVTLLAGQGYGVERILAASLAGRLVSLIAALGWAGLFWFTGGRARKPA